MKTISSRSKRTVATLKTSRSKKSSKVTGMGTSGIIFIAPTLFLLGVFFLLPLIAIIYLSLTQWSLVGAPDFVGFQNYQGIFSNPQFWSAMAVTGKISLFMAIPGALFAFILAILINGGKHTNFFSTVILFPLVFPSVVSVFIWEAMFKGDGVLNSALGVHIKWISSTDWALPSLALMMLWTNLGYYTIIALAGVKDVPTELYDAASIDGAGYFKKIRWVTIPLVKPIILFILMIATSDALTLFIQPFLLTQGGPGDATRTLSQLIYQTAFLYTDVGKASAIAVVLLIAALIVAGFQFKFFSHEKEA